MPSTWSPFNGKPTSLQTITSSYTVPSGFYARVTANAKGGGTVTVNGTALLASTGRTWNALATSLLDYSVMGLTGGGTIDGIATEGGSTPNSGRAFTSETAAQESSVAESFWVPAGATIAVSGDARALAQVYQG